MISNGEMDFQFIILFETLLIGPIVGAFMIGAISALIDREIPSFLQLVSVMSFAQSLAVMIVTQMTVREVSSVRIFLGALVLILLFFTLLFQATIEQRQQIETQIHVTSVLKEKLMGKLKNQEDLAILLTLAGRMIDVDYHPNSYRNRLSGYRRRERRKQFINIVNYFLETTKKHDVSIEEEDLLIPELARKKLNTPHIFITLVSFTLYAIIISLSLLV